MNYKTVTVLIALAFSTYTFANAQSKTGDYRFVEITSDAALITIGVQPNCPLRIENPKLVFDLETREFRLLYSVRNISDKAIESFTISKWNVGGGGGDLRTPSRKLLLPGEIFIVGDADPEKIIPLNDKLKKRIGLRDGLHTIIILLIKEVRSTERRIYEIDNTEDKLVNFLNRTSVEQL
jgi:hypothetical protein